MLTKQLSVSAKILLIKYFVLSGVIICLVGCQTAPEQRRQELKGIKAWEINFKAEGYPAGWPSLGTLGPQCQMIRGEFHNHGIAGNVEDNPPSLLDVLGVPAPEKSPDQVALDISTQWSDSSGDTAASLQVYFVNSTHTAFPRHPEVFSNCFCLNKILFCSHSFGEAMGSIGFFGESRVFFTRAEDGSLVVKKEQKDFGVVVIIPFYSSSTEWMRFPSTENKTQE